MNIGSECVLSQGKRLTTYYWGPKLILSESPESSWSDPPFRPMHLWAMKIINHSWWEREHSLGWTPSLASTAEAITAETKVKIAFQVGSNGSVARPIWSEGSVVVSAVAKKAIVVSIGRTKESGLNFILPKIENSIKTLTCQVQGSNLRASSSPSQETQYL